MAAVAALLSPPSSLTNSYSPIPPRFLIARDGSRSGPRRKRRNGKASAPVVCCHCTTPTSMNSFRRRNLLLSGLSSSFALILPISESRKPERYSSAAPLSPDARQRIVSERVDMINNLVISVSIGPPNPRFLTSNDKSAWKAKDVADSVLSDKTALRVTSGQRMAESSVLDSHSLDVGGEPYWYYEYLIRKSPTKSAQEPNLFRHNVASTAERDGYLYSLNASTLSKQWEYLGPFLQKTVASFRLLPPTENYVPPYKDPWRFW
ncbi:psbP domain-containing protein 5, chloroplastic-like isoform X4 [Musa acuminata AAA Group]|uniref:psbP domain-containing protein 5, chloroplastic-like isoform X4 n=1 Tax=Musa acuminata AAA Group TaxID=214697 RepID=UPI0031DD83C2